MRVLAVLALLVVACSAAVTPITSLVNHLIANSAISTTVTNNYETDYRIRPVAACTGTSAPTLAALNLTSLRVCQASSNVFPFYNSTGSGIEADLLASFSTQLTTLYGASFTVQRVSVTTPGTAGYFGSLRAALEAGNCDTIIGNVNQNTDRDAVLDSSCGYAATQPAFVRGDLNASVTLTTLAQITAAAQNITVKVGCVAGSIYSTVVAGLIATNSNVSLTNYANTTSGYDAVAAQQIHLFFADEATLWSQRNDATHLCQANTTVCTITSFPVPPATTTTQLPYVAYQMKVGGVVTTTTTVAPGTSTTPAPTTTNAASVVGVAAAAVFAAVALLF